LDLYKTFTANYTFDCRLWLINGMVLGVEAWGWRLRVSRASGARRHAAMQRTLERCSAVALAAGDQRRNRSADTVRDEFEGTTNTLNSSLSSRVSAYIGFNDFLLTSNIVSEMPCYTFVSSKHAKMCELTLTLSIRQCYLDCLS
jgi:hypothetical protein